MARYSYDIASSFESMMDKEGRHPGYLTWILYDKARGLQFEIVTSGAGEGRFYWSDYRASFIQETGLWQFSMPCTLHGIRKTLRSLYEDELKQYEELGSTIHIRKI